MIEFDYKLDFKKFHPGGNLGNKLKTVSDLMLTHNKIPFVNENDVMKKALKTLNSKKLGFLVVINNQGLNTGIFTDGDLKRLMQHQSDDYEDNTEGIRRLKHSDLIIADVFKIENLKDLSKLSSRTKLDFWHTV